MQVRGDAAVAVRNYCAQTAALALLHGTAEPLRKGLHAALLLAAVIPADADPRAVDEGPDTSGLRYIALVAERLGYNLDEELAFLGEPDFARALTHFGICAADIGIEIDNPEPLAVVDDRWGDIVVTDPLSGPTFDRLLPDARSSRP